MGNVSSDRFGGCGRFGGVRKTFAKKSFQLSTKCKIAKYFCRIVSNSERLIKLRELEIVYTCEGGPGPRVPFGHAGFFSTKKHVCN